MLKTLINQILKNKPKTIVFSVLQEDIDKSSDASISRCLSHCIMATALTRHFKLNIGGGNDSIEVGVTTKE